MPDNYFRILPLGRIREPGHCVAGFPVSQVLHPMIAQTGHALAPGDQHAFTDVGEPRVRFHGLSDLQCNGGDGVADRFDNFRLLLHTDRTSQGIAQ